MSYHADDTICAVATAGGGAARGIIRISGMNAANVAAHLFRSDDDSTISAIRRATRLPGRISADGGSTDRSLPCDLYLWPTDRSYTREPVAELHTLGSPPVLEPLINTLCRAG